MRDIRMGGLVVGEFRKIAKGFYLEGLSYDFERDVIWHSAPLEGGICAVNTDGLPRGSFNLDRRWTGGILFGTCDVEMIATARDTRPPAVYRLTQDRNVISLDDAIHFSNGLACDALRRRFYCRRLVPDIVGLGCARRPDAGKQADRAGQK